MASGTTPLAVAFSAVCFLAGALFDRSRGPGPFFRCFFASSMRATPCTTGRKRLRRFTDCALLLLSLLRNSTLLEDYVVSMDGFGTALALAVGTGMDNFAVGAAYGCRGRRVLHVSNWLIAGSNAATTAGTMFVGAQILRIVSTETASNIG